MALFKKELTQKQIEKREAAILAKERELHHLEVLKQAEIDEFNKNVNILDMFENLSDESKEATKSLILKMEEGRALLANAVKYRAPYMLCKYLTELANSFHHFYNYTRVLSEDKKDSIMKLSIVNSFKIIMATMLNLIGVSAPEKM